MTDPARPNLDPLPGPASSSDSTEDAAAKARLPRPDLSDVERRAPRPDAPQEASPEILGYGGYDDAMAGVETMDVMPPPLEIEIDWGLEAEREKLERLDEELERGRENSKLLNEGIHLGAEILGEVASSVFPPAAFLGPAVSGVQYLQSSHQRIQMERIKSWEKYLPAIDGLAEEYMRVMSMEDSEKRNAADLLLTWRLDEIAGGVAAAQIRAERARGPKGRLKKALDGRSPDEIDPDDMTAEVTVMKNAITRQVFSTWNQMRLHAMGSPDRGLSPIEILAEIKGMDRHELARAQAEHTKHFPSNLKKEQEHSVPADEQSHGIDR